MSATTIIVAWVLAIALWLWGHWLGRESGKLHGFAAGYDKGWRDATEGFHDDNVIVFDHVAAQREAARKRTQ